MREILGKRRKSSPELLRAALTCAERWHWPVVPGAGTDARGGCACLRPDCPVPGAHPHDPGLLAATRDPRMVRWWWTRRPDQPLVLATGDRVSAVSLPAVAGARALGAFGKLGVRTGPVVATPTRFAVLVEPYSLEELGELLDRHEWVPSSLRYHGEGGYLVLPPSPVGSGGTAGARWVRRPVVDPGDRAPWLPSVRVVVDTLVQAGRTAPDGSRLSY
ncbi:bifunctional DNA primase/polymerase [Streptomyces sp. NPDC058864]